MNRSQTPRLLAAVVVSFAIVVTGCAKRPQDIPPAEVSEARFRNLSCDELFQQESTIKARRLDVERQQTVTRMLNLLFPITMLADLANEEQVAEAKGEHAVVKRKIDERC